MIMHILLALMYDDHTKSDTKEFFYCKYIELQFTMRIQTTEIADNICQEFRLTSLVLGKTTL